MHTIYVVDDATRWWWCHDLGWSWTRCTMNVTSLRIVNNRPARNICAHVFVVYVFAYYVGYALMLTYKSSLKHTEFGGLCIWCGILGNCRGLEFFLKASWTLPEMCRLVRTFFEDKNQFIRNISLENISFW